MTGTSIRFDGDVAHRLGKKLAKMDLTKGDQVTLAALCDRGYDDILVTVLSERTSRERHVAVRERRRRVVRSDRAS